MSTSTNGQMVVHTEQPRPLAKADPTRAFEPGDIAEGFHLAKLLVQSGLMPRGVQRPEAAFAIIAAGRELGLTAMQSLRSIHIIEGKPTLSADLIAALCKSRPDVCQYFRLVESTDKVARYETQRRGEPAPTTMSFTIEDAQRAGVTGKDNWKKYPAAMLRARCITALARAVYPDLAMGVYDPDEVADMEPPRPARMEVVQPPASQPAPVDDSTFSDICARIAATDRRAALNKIAADTKKALASKAITESQYQAIVKACNRKAELLASAPKDRPSEPSEPKPPPDDGPDYGDDVHEREPGEEG